MDTELYKFIVYLKDKDSDRAYLYKSQASTNIDLPEDIFVNNCNMEYGHKYLVFVNDAMTEIVTVDKMIPGNTWIRNELKNIAVYNKNLSTTKGRTKREVLEIPEDIIMDPVKWEFIISTIKLGQYPLFTGPSGCGKSVTARGIAKAMNYDYYYMNCGAMFKPKQTLVGSVQAKDGSTFLVNSEFMNYFKSEKPTLILMDELSRIPSQAANYFMTICDREQSYIYVEELGERIYKGKDVIFIATANFGIQYVDTRKLDNALLNRFIPYHLNYLPPEDEKRLINMKVKGLNQAELNMLIKHANVLRNNFDVLGQEISHRHTIDMARYMSIGFSYKEVLNNILINLFVNGNEDKRELVEQLLNAK